MNVNDPVNVNDPNSKYGIGQERSTVDTSAVKSNLNTVASSSSRDALSFFNYHEFLVNDYSLILGSRSSLLSSSTSPVDAQTTKHRTKAIVINHFPNNHVATSSATYKSTRVIRIPREFHSHELGYMIPQFSTYWPGQEPAALLDQSQDPYEFQPVGEFDDHSLFGATSITPLEAGLITPQEFNTIITKINHLLLQAFNPFSLANLLENFLDLITGTFYSRIFSRYVLRNYSQRKLLELETYLDVDVNQNLFNASDRDIKFISPRRCGYLSVCIPPFFCVS